MLRTRGQAGRGFGGRRATIARKFAVDSLQMQQTDSSQVQLSVAAWLRRWSRFAGADALIE